MMMDMLYQPSKRVNNIQDRISTCERKETNFKKNDICIHSALHTTDTNASKALAVMAKNSKR